MLGQGGIHETCLGYLRKATYKSERLLPACHHVSGENASEKHGRAESRPTGSTLQISGLWSNDQEADGAWGTIPRLQLSRVLDIDLALDQTVKLHGLYLKPLQKETEKAPVPGRMQKEARGLGPTTCRMYLGAHRNCELTLANESE